MFKKADKVFKFTFHNQVTSGSYKTMTILITLLLFIIPVAIFGMIGVFTGNKEDESTESGIDKVYVVNSIAPDVDYNTLNLMQTENYTDIAYARAENLDAAIDEITKNGEKTSVVLIIEKNEDGYLIANTVYPDDTLLEADKMKHFNEFLSEQEQVLTVLSGGLSPESIMLFSVPTSKDVYTTAGYETGTSIYETDKESLRQKDNQEILPAFNMILVFVTVMIVYFIVLAYGASINQNVVLEKASKLMDTMLISVPPRSLIFGKLLGVLLAAFIQFYLWIAALAGGMIVGVKFYESLAPDSELALINFFKSFSELGLFKPLNIVIGVLVLTFGIVLYCALAAISGAISSSKEEATSNQSIFVILLVVCFYLVLMKGMEGEVPNWLYIFPGTAAMVLPAGICSGTVSVTIALISLAVMAVTAVAALVLAGKLYVMMALFKGNNVKIGKALKMLFSSQNKVPKQTKES